MNMTGIEDIRLRLEQIGLSAREASIYVLLITHGQLRIQKIATLAHIPRSSVYECLKRLYELGIAEEVVEEHHKIVRPYPLGIVRQSLDKRITNMQRLSKDLAKIERNIDEGMIATTSAPISVRYYKGRSGARQIFWNSLKTTDTVRVFSEWGRSRYVGVNFYANFVTESHKRTFKEKVLINPTEAALESIRQSNHPGSTLARTRINDIRVIDEETMTIKGETLLYDAIYAHVYLRAVEINGFEIESPIFVTAQRSLFDSLWENATPVATLL